MFKIRTSIFELGQGDKVIEGGTRQSRGPHRIWSL